MRSNRPQPTLRTWRIALFVFVALQLMDLFTSLAVLSKGGVEMNPVVRALMPWAGPAVSILMSKIAVVTLVCLLSQRIWLVRFANLFYTAIVGWNVVVLTRLR